MKRMLAGILAMVLMFVSSAAVWAETMEPTQSPGTEYDFKSFRWGDSMETVKAVEGKPIYSGKVDGVDATYIGYSTTAVGLDVVVAYYFCDEGLYAVAYLLDETHSNDSLYIDDYETFRDALTKKYGEALFDWENWENDSKKEYYADDKGKALCYGYLSYLTLWLLDRTHITMNMSADNYKITMTVVYESNVVSPGEADFSGEI